MNGTTYWREKEIKSMQRKLEGEWHERTSQTVRGERCTPLRWASLLLYSNVDALKTMEPELGGMTYGKPWWTCFCVPKWKIQQATHRYCRTRKATRPTWRNQSLAVDVQRRSIKRRRKESPLRNNEITIRYTAGASKNQRKRTKNSVIRVRNRFQCA